MEAGASGSHLWPQTARTSGQRRRLCFPRSLDIGAQDEAQRETTGESLGVEGLRGMEGLRAQSGAQGGPGWEDRFRGPLAADRLRLPPPPSSPPQTPRACAPRPHAPPRGARSSTPAMEGVGRAGERSVNPIPLHLPPDPRPPGPAVPRGPGCPRLRACEVACARGGPRSRQGCPGPGPPHLPPRPLPAVQLPAQRGVARGRCLGMGCAGSLRRWGNSRTHPCDFSSNPHTCTM